MAEAKCPNCGEKERFYFCSRSYEYFKLEAMPEGGCVELGDLDEAYHDDEYRDHLWCEACDKLFNLDGFEISQEDMEKSK